MKSRIMTEESVFHSPSIASATLSVASSAATACSLDGPCRHLHCQRIAFGSFAQRLTSPLLTFAMTRTMACSEGVMSTAPDPLNLACRMLQTYAIHRFSSWAIDSIAKKDEEIKRSVVFDKRGLICGCSLMRRGGPLSPPARSESMQ